MLHLLLHLSIVLLSFTHQGKTRGQRFTRPTRDSWLGGKTVRCHPHKNDPSVPERHEKIYSTRLFMAMSLSHTKISIICFQGDEGPIGPPGPTGLEVSYWLNTWSCEKRRIGIRPSVGQNIRLIVSNVSYVRITRCEYV